MGDKHRSDIQIDSSLSTDLYVQVKHPPNPSSSDDKDSSIPHTESDPSVAVDNRGCYNVNNSKNCSNNPNNTPISRKDLNNPNNPNNPNNTNNSGGGITQFTHHLPSPAAFRLSPGLSPGLTPASPVARPLSPASSAVCAVSSSVSSTPSVPSCASSCSPSTPAPGGAGETHTREVLEGGIGECGNDKPNNYNNDEKKCNPNNNLNNPNNPNNPTNPTNLKNNPKKKLNDSSIGGSWESYQHWDLVKLTQHYLQFLIARSYTQAQHNKHQHSDPSLSSDAGSENNHRVPNVNVNAGKGLLIHCISGWDRTPMFVTLLRLSLWADGLVHTHTHSLSLSFFLSLFS